MIEIVDKSAVFLFGKNDIHERMLRKWVLCVFFDKHIFIDG